MTYIVITMDEDGDMTVVELGDLAMKEALAEWSTEKADPDSFLDHIADRDPNYWSTRMKVSGPVRLIIEGRIVKPTPVETVTRLDFQ